MFTFPHTELKPLHKMILRGSRAAHVLGIAYNVARSRSLIGSSVSFEEYCERRRKAEQEEVKL